MIARVNNAQSGLVENDSVVGLVLNLSLGPLLLLSGLGRRLGGSRDLGLGLGGHLVD